MKHRFHIPKKLRTRLESRRYGERWSDVRGIVEENDFIVQNGGFTLAHGYQSLPSAPLADIFDCPSSPEPITPRFATTQICVAHVDTLSAAIELGDACALNFANAETPGGRYRSGGRAQEEDLCRLLPQLYPSLASVSYPIPPGRALLSRGLLSVRQPGTYDLCLSLGQCSIITAAMPCGIADRRPKGGWDESPWADTVSLRIRSVLNAAKHSGHANLVLGAFGCGAFGNPAKNTAIIFRRLLCSDEFRGAFESVVFAVLDPLGTGNLRPFREQLGQLKMWPPPETDETKDS